MQHPESADLRASIAALVAASTVTAVARRLGLTPEVVARLAGGLDCRAGTLSLARERLQAMRNGQPMGISDAVGRPR
jgi:hypothetical protein